MCYLGVLALGVVGLLRFRWTIPALFGLCVVGVIATSYGPVDSTYIANFARFGIMFSAGALVYQYQAKLPVRPWLFAVSLVVLGASTMLPDYRLVAALPIAYLLISVSALVKTPALRLRNDISYGVYIYAFPVQQILAGIGIGAAGVLPYALLTIALTVPLAAASWYFIEKPALRWKRRSPVTAPSSSETAAASI